MPHLMISWRALRALQDLWTFRATVDWEGYDEFKRAVLALPREEPVVCRPPDVQPAAVLEP